MSWYKDLTSCESLSDFINKGIFNSLAELDGELRLELGEYEYANLIHRLKHGNS